MVTHSLWANDAIDLGQHLAQVMACCLTAPSHYPNQCWLIISEVLWHSPDGNFTENAQHIYPWYDLENYEFKTTATSPRAQWVELMVQTISHEMGCTILNTMTYHTLMTPICTLKADMWSAQNQACWRWAPLRSGTLADSECLSSAHSTQPAKNLGHV